MWKGYGEWTGTGLAEAVEEEHERFDSDLKERLDGLGVVDYRSD